MQPASRTDLPRSNTRLHLPGIVNLLLTPLPLFALQPLLKPIAVHVARTQPQLFTRLGPHAGKRFLIDPLDLPFGLALMPDSEKPLLQGYRREQPPAHDARIAGAFLDLFGLIDGSADGDALFFSRELQITGDTEAVVALRNALDDMEGSLMDIVGGAFGPLSKPASLAIDGLRAIRARNAHA
jgi:predicted lipid carrier protein YhbT